MPTNLFEELFTTREEYNIQPPWYELQEDNHAVVQAIENLKYEFDTFKKSLTEDFNIMVEKLRSCARAQDLVDEQGGSLDEFLESFRRY